MKSPTRWLWLAVIGAVLAGLLLLSPVLYETGSHFLLKADESPPPAMAKQSANVFELSVIVKSVKTVHQFSGKAIPVDPDPMYVAGVELLKASNPPEFQRGELLNFAVHSPVLTFRLPQEDLPGRQFRLLFVRGNEAGRNRLELQVVTGPSPESMPGISVKPRAPAATTKQIKSLIAQLAEIDSPDYGLSATMSGHAFLPIEGRYETETFLLTDHGLRSSDTLRELVKLGPTALPFLLDALDDTTPTQLRMNHGSPFGGMWLANELRGNPASAHEREILWPSMWLNDEESEETIDSYTVKVGDVCFVAIGQIVGRRYQAVRYQPSGCIVINSPTQDSLLRKQVRAIWSSDNPHQKLFDSLLFDYSTRGVFNGDSLGGWDVGSDLQIEAALRLLYYFPTESTPLIVDRLKSLKVHRTGPPSSQPASPEELDAFSRREVANGVRAAGFIEAVKWSNTPEIREALAEIANRSDDPDIQSLLAD